MHFLNSCMQVNQLGSDMEVSIYPILTLAYVNGAIDFWKINRKLRVDNNPHSIQYMVLLKLIASLTAVIELVILYKFKKVLLL